MPPINDNFVNAHDLDGPSGATAINNVGATYEAGEPANSLGVGAHASVWYKTTLGTSLGNGWRATFDTNATPEMWDSTLEVFTGSDVNALTLLDNNDDINYPTNIRSRLQLVGVDDGTTVYIRVEGWETYPGYTIGPHTADGVLTWSIAPVLPIPSWSSIAAVHLHPGDPDVPSFRNLVEGDEYRLTGTNLNYVSRVTLGGVACSFTIVDSTHLRFTAARAIHISDLVVENADGAGQTVSFTLWFSPGWVQGPNVWSDDVREGSPNVDGYGLSAYLSAPNDSVVPGPRGSGTPGAFGRDNWSGEWAAPTTPDNTFQYFMMFRTLGADIENLANTRADINFPYVFIDPTAYPAAAVYVSYEEDGGIPVARGSVKFQRKVYMQTTLERESLSGRSYVYADIVAGGHADVFAQHFHELVVPASMIQRNPTTHQVHLNPDVWPDLSMLPVIATHPAVPTGQSPALQVNPEALYEYYTDVEEDVFDYVDHPQIMFLVVNEHHTGGAQLIAPPADGSFVGGDLTNYAAKTAQSDFVLTEGVGQQGVGNIFVLYTPPRYRFLYPVSRPPFAGASATSGVRFDTRH